MNTIERVKEICKEKGISMHKMEMDLGFSNGYIAGLRKGTLPPDRLSDVAKYLNVSQNYLLTGDTEQDGPIYYFNPETAELAQRLFEDKNLRVLFDAAQDADPEDIKIATDLLQTLKNRGKDDGAGF